MAGSWSTNSSKGNATGILISVANHAAPQSAGGRHRLRQTLTATDLVMAITILNQAVLNITPAALTTYTLTGFNVPSGTDTLVLVITMRGGSATTAAEITSVTHNAIAMTMGVDNFTVGDQEINTWAGYQRAKCWHV